MLINLKKKIHFIKSWLPILYLWNLRRLGRQKKQAEKYSDCERIISLYKKSFARNPKLDIPTLFTEKLQWLKLNFRESFLTELVDKYEVKNVLRDKGYEHILNDTIALWRNVSEINIETLPDSFVIKATHGSGMNIIVNDKRKINWFWWKKIMDVWLKQNIYIDGREWPYKNVVPGLICESNIANGKQDLKDYKVYCFNGEPKYIQVDSDRFSSHKRDFYNMKWEKQEFQYDDYENAGNIDKPDNLNQMIEIAIELSTGLPFVRVDFYNINNKVYFGEMTFFPDSGFAHFNPENYDQIFGDKLDLTGYTNEK